MMHRRASLLVLFLLMLIPAAPRGGVRAQSAPANGPSSEWRVRRVDGGRATTVELRQLAAPDEEWFISSRQLADILGVGRFWRTDVRKLVLRVDDQRITFTVGARSVVGDNETILLHQAVIYFEGEPWIPLEFLSAVLPRLSDRQAAIDESSMAIALGERRLNVSGMEVRNEGDQTVLRIHLDSALAFRVDDSRVRNLVIKLYGGALDPTQILLTTPRGLIDAVRGRQENGFAMVEVDLSQLASRYQSLTEDGGKTILLRIEQAPVTLIPEPEPRGAHVVQTLPPEKRGREVEVRRVVIDAGHGGGDFGAEGLNGLREKDVTLAVARRLEEILERRHDIEVILTRTSDESIGLIERTETANRYSADLFISLHCNAWPSGGAQGVETYFLSPAKTEWDADVARKENAGIGAAEDLDFILWDLVQNAYIQESATLAEEVQERLAADLGLVNRGVKQAGFRVLVGAFMPAILVERPRLQAGISAHQAPAGDGQVEFPVADPVERQVGPRPPAPLQAHLKRIGDRRIAEPIYFSEGPVRHPAVLDDLNHVDFIAPAHVESDIDPGAGANGLAHHRAVDGEIKLDAVAGQGVGAPGPDGLQNRGAVEVARQHPQQPLAMGAGKAVVAVAGGDETEAQAPGQRRGHGVGGLAPAHRVAEEGIGPAIVLGIAVLGKYLDHRGAGFLENTPIDAAAARRVGQVMRQHQGVVLLAEAAQGRDVPGESQGAVIVGEDHALIAEMAGMPFETQERGKRPIPVGPGDQILDLGPALGQALEPCKPVVFAAPFHGLHVVPARLAGEGEEIQMGAGHVDAARHRANTIAHGIVVVDIAEQEPILLGHRAGPPWCPW